MESENLSYYLIDPFEKTIMPVYYDGDFHSIYGLIDCHTFDVARCGKYDLYIDDEGLFKGEDQRFFLCQDFPYQALGGKALVAGVDTEGNTVPPAVTLEELEAKIFFVERIVWKGK